MLQANREPITRCWPWFRTRTSTAMTNRTRAFSRTWIPGARRGTIATSTAGKHRSYARTARSSARPCSCVTGGSMCGATLARNCTTSMRGCIGPRRDRTDRTGCSPRSFSTGYSSDRPF